MSTKGLVSLQKTYENDIMMKARIDTLLEEVFFCIIEPSIEKREKSIRKKLEV